MTETANTKLNIIKEFRDLEYKQWIGIIAGIVVAMLLTCTGMILSMCLGFFIVAILLYMIPHITGVKSAKIKAIIGAVFIVAVLIVSATAYSGSAVDKQAFTGHNYFADVTWDGEELVITPTDKEVNYQAKYANITGMAFGQPYTYDKGNMVQIELKAVEDKVVGHATLPKGQYVYIQVDALDKDGTIVEFSQIFYNNGISPADVNSLNFNGSLLTIGEIGLVFYLLLIFSTLIRMYSEKARTKMEKDGRLYPAGYDKCKQCGCMVLPGEITCRKCGAPIEVPEELKVLHKKDFFVCSKCGTEVPMDAQFCPKCGESFDEKTENVITHADGTTDTSTETFECSDCGKIVPANAKRCPYCGAVFDEEEDDKPQQKQ